MNSTTRKPFSKEIIKIENIELVCQNIFDKLKKDVKHKLQRRGGVVGISGGIDSSVVLALASKAFGSKNVLGVMLPEQDSSPDSRMLAEKLAGKFEVSTLVEDILGR